MHYETVIIGAGMSGLAAGIRLAHFDRKVCVLERHTRLGGLNSYYRLHGRSFDVGLHALTNFCSPDDRRAPLNRLLRQLRLKREDFDLCEQSFSKVSFRDRELRFTNDFEVLKREIVEKFPAQQEGFERLVKHIAEFDALAFDAPAHSAGAVLRKYLSDRLLIDMLLCPLMYYGNSREGDMDFAQFCIMFQSIFLEGFCRPTIGVRQIVGVLTRRFRQCNGELRTGCGVRVIRPGRGGGLSLELDDGSTITADNVLSSAGFLETMRMCRPEPGEVSTTEPGRMAYVESIFVLNQRVSEMGHDAAIVFYSDSERFSYRPPAEPVKFDSGVLCSPGNFRAPEGRGPEPMLRLTHLADYEAWNGMDDQTYANTKRETLEKQLDILECFVPGSAEHVVCTDMFTPVTVERFTGHINGAVYGCPVKRKDGTTPVKNLFICGTDQGFLGITGAILSGVSMANYHLLR